MTWQEFANSLSQTMPPAELSPYLQALWFDAKNDWDRAHEIAQDVDDRTGSWIHAYLHRKEGDLGNAAYWYRRAGKPVPSSTLREEWEAMVKALLA
ncbi:MAG: hypothetical protein INR73_24745 [Williamsia sp.]|nr:hypothetical protein [Williamsia sp.]